MMFKEDIIFKIEELFSSPRWIQNVFLKIMQQKDIREEKQERKRLSVSIELSFLREINKLSKSAWVSMDYSNALSKSIYF
jgi:hypothetical protein